MRNLGKHRILTLLVGLLTALVIVFSQLFYFQAATYCQKKVETTQHDKNTGGTESYISIPSSTISSTPHIEINQDLSFVLEILFEKKAEEQLPANITASAGRLFQTLFRFIIAPNAP
jgi:hypothetical protein